MKRILVTFCFILVFKAVAAELARILLLGLMSPGDNDQLSYIQGELPSKSRLTLTVPLSRTSLVSSDSIRKRTGPRACFH